MKAMLHFALLSCAIAVKAANPTATLNSGPIYGLTTSLPGAIAPVNKFLGIPYAAPPKRFGVPKPPKKWYFPKSVTAFQPSCMQYIPDTDFTDQDILNDLFNSHPPESEDCLYLNAFAPAARGPPNGRPVVVFIPGGGWQMGNGLVDLSGFAAYEDIVAFTFNYRTNIFGFPNSAELPLQERNLGLLDQQLALAWVQANAKAFGGDPSKVTIWGQSVGSMSVDLHLHGYANSHPPPFRAAIMSSGQYSFGLVSLSKDPRNTRDWDSVAKAVGCVGNSTLGCMRSMPAQKLLDAMAVAGSSIMPILDNTTVTKGRDVAWREGRIAKVPILATTMAEEGRTLVGRRISIEQFLMAYLPQPFVTKEQHEAIMSFYRKKGGLQTDFDVLAAIYTDFLWRCPHQVLANASTAINNPMWRGYLNFTIQDILPKKYQFLGKFHGADVLILFTNQTFDRDLEGPSLLSPQLYTLAKYLRGMIGKFVRNPTDGPGWPAVGPLYAPFDVASLGDIGDEKTAGATPVNRTALDTDCAVFEGISALFEEFSPYAM